MRRSVLWVVVPVLALGACGSGDDGDAAGGATTAPATATSAPASPTGPTLTPGTADAMAIQSFTCRPDAKGTWTITGVLKNTEEKARDYVVAAFIGEQSGPARVVELAKVQGGASVPFTLAPAPGAGAGPCHLQALVVQ